MQNNKTVSLLTKIIDNFVPKTLHLASKNESCGEKSLNDVCNNNYTCENVQNEKCGAY